MSARRKRVIYQIKDNVAINPSKTRAKMAKTQNTIGICSYCVLYRTAISVNSNTTPPRADPMVVLRIIFADGTHWFKSYCYLSQSLRKTLRLLPLEPMIKQSSLKRNVSLPHFTTYQRPSLLWITPNYWTYYSFLAYMDSHWYGFIIF